MFGVDMCEDGFFGIRLLVAKGTVEFRIGSHFHFGVVGFLHFSECFGEFLLQLTDVLRMSLFLRVGLEIPLAFSAFDVQKVIFGESDSRVILQSAVFFVCVGDVGQQVGRNVLKYAWAVGTAEHNFRMHRPFRVDRSVKRHYHQFRSVRFRGDAKIGTKSFELGTILLLRKLTVPKK